jgi:hypothetical protein
MHMRFTRLALSRRLARSTGPMALLALAFCGSGNTLGAGPAFVAGQAVSVQVAPTTATLPERGLQTFAATVTGSSDTAVTWQSDCGAITAAGVFTAPAAVTTCHVVATSAADSTKAGTSLVTVQPVDTTWTPLKVGAGGWLTGMDFDRSGATLVARTDTMGAYVKDSTSPSSTWQQVVRADTMPAGFVANMGDWLNEGVYEIRVAPSDPNRLYMMFKGNVYRSANRGAAWTQASFATGTTLDPNGQRRIWGEKMAVDPANPNVVYAGTISAGLWSTGDGGATWTAVSAVPASTGTYADAGITGLVFDGSSGTTGGKTNVIYATSNGNGTYRSSDAGATWSLLAGGPNKVTHAAVASDGVYYSVGLTSTLYRYANPGNPGGLPTGWTSPTVANVTWFTVAPDPFNPARIVLGDDGGSLAISPDRGATWLEQRPSWGPVYQNRTRVATDVPWLAFANENYMSSGTQRFDPQVPNKLWFSEGIGVWYSTDFSTAATTTWNSSSAGIEQLVARDVCVPPGSPNVVLAGMDRSVWVIPKTNASYPASYKTMGSSSSLILAYAVDYARANASNLVAIVNRGLAGEPEVSGYSLDGGATWTTFPVQPGSGGQGGNVVATSIDNIVAVIGTKYAYRSTDRGNTWTPLTLPGDGGGNNSNLHGGYNTKKHVLALDGVDAHTIYLYFYTHGLYRSTDDGATWTLVTSNTFDGANMYWQTKLRSVPGQAGHLFLTAGQAGGVGSANPAGTSLWRSTDGGSTWTTVPGMAEPYDVAVGKAAPGATYPAIYVVGWYNKVYGIWRSTDNAKTWSNIGPYPYNNFDEINAIAASQDVYGDVYLAFTGSGWGYGRLGP